MEMSKQCLIQFGNLLTGLKRIFHQNNLSINVFWDTILVNIVQNWNPILMPNREDIGTSVNVSDVGKRTKKTSFTVITMILIF